MVEDARKDGKIATLEKDIEILELKSQIKVSELTAKLTAELEKAQECNVELTAIILRMSKQDESNEKIENPHQNCDDRDEGCSFCDDARKYETMDFDKLEVYQQQHLERWRGYQSGMSE